MALNGKLRGSVDLGTYFDGTHNNNLLKPFLKPGLSKRVEVKNLVKATKRRPSKLEQQQKARRIKEMLQEGEHKPKHKRVSQPG